jgi:parallel beta-helix repeat protein
MPRKIRIAPTLSLFILAATLLTALPAAAREEIVEIRAAGTRRAPLVLDSPGRYRVVNDIVVASGDAIVIRGSNVNLDLNGHFVSTESPQTGRGIVIEGARGAWVGNGQVGKFNMNVAVLDSVNVSVEKLLIDGQGVPPVNPMQAREMGIVLVNSRGTVIQHNTISSVNLGIFIRGGQATGNRIQGNTVVGGGTPANNLLGICYNPAPGAGDREDPNVPGPRGDVIYGNHIARFGYAVGISAGSLANIFRGNTFASFNGPFMEPETLVENGGTNVNAENIAVPIPATVLTRP